MGTGFLDALTFQSIIPIITFIVVATISPGPNNIMLAASGMQFGFRPTLPHIVGIHLGFYTLLFMAWLGLSQLILGVPEILLFLRIFGSVYLCYLAWKIFGLTLLQTGAKQTRPLNIWQAGVFQFANPKAWMMTTSAMALAIPLVGSADTAAIVLCIVWASLGFGCNCLWVLGGMSLNRLLEKPGIRRLICSGLALLTIATVAMFWMN